MGRPRAAAAPLWPGLPNLSHQLFLGRAWMLQEDAAALRAVRPWPSAIGVPQHRDSLYLRSLYALTSRQAQSAWMSAGAGG